LTEEGRKSEKNIEHSPELMKKYRARQICKTNILQKFGKKYRAKPMKIEHFQKGAFPHQKSNGPSLSILSNARRLWKNELARKSYRYLQTFFDLLKAFHVFVKPR
jgi:hypothetical protein